MSTVAEKVSFATGLNFTATSADYVSLDQSSEGKNPPPPKKKTKKNMVNLLMTATHDLSPSALSTISGAWAL